MSRFAKTKRILRGDEIDRFSRTSDRLEDQAFDLFVSEMRGRQEHDRSLRAFYTVRLGRREYRSLDEFKRDYPNETRRALRRLEDGTSSLFRNANDSEDPRS